MENMDYKDFKLDYSAFDVLRQEAMELSNKLQTSSEPEIVIRYVKEEASALTLSMLYAIEKSISITSRLDRYAIENKLRDSSIAATAASVALSDGNYLLAVQTLSTIDDAHDIKEDMDIVFKSWRDVDKMLASYFTPREIEAIEKEVPFIHKQTFSYEKRFADQMIFIEMRQKVETAVYDTIIEVEREDLKGKLLNSGQLQFDDLPEENIFLDNGDGGNQDPDENLFLKGKI